MQGSLADTSGQHLVNVAGRMWAGSGPPAKCWLGAPRAQRSLKEYGPVLVGCNKVFVTILHKLMSGALSGAARCLSRLAVPAASLPR